MQVYLDNNATTRPHPEVIEAYVQAQQISWGNASSPHQAGASAQCTLRETKAAIARYVGCDPGELVMTSGATEANNLALTGAFTAEQYRKSPRRKILISAIEHPSVLESALDLVSKGAEVKVIPVNAEGTIDIARLERELSDQVLLVSVMSANNEIGTLQPIAKIATLARQAGALFHTDATQSLGKINLNMKALGIDLLSASAHKLHGPKGIGILAVKRGTRIAAQIKGGGHQSGRRSGTIDVPSAVGFAKALEVVDKQALWDNVKMLREQLFRGLQASASPIQRISSYENCLPNTLNIRFVGVDAEALMASAPDICCSPGSACSQATPQPSHVLLAMGLDRQAAGECIRFSLSAWTTTIEIEQAIKETSEAVRYVRDVMKEAA